MDSELERSREHEFKVEASTPEWLAALGASVKASYAYRRITRGGQLIEDAARHAHVDAGTIGQRAIDDEGFGDVLLTAGERAITTGDPELRDTLARLVAAAFNDDAPIETVSFLLEQVAQLEPAHLRVLRAVSLLPHTDGESPPYTVVVERRVNADPGLAAASLPRLAALGLVVDEGVGRSGPVGAPLRARSEWALTELGRQLLQMSGAFEEAD